MNDNIKKQINELILEQPDITISKIIKELGLNLKYDRVLKFVKEEHILCMRVLIPGYINSNTRFIATKNLCINDLSFLRRKKAVSKAAYFRYEFLERTELNLVDSKERITIIRSYKKENNE